MSNYENRYGRDSNMPLGLYWDTHKLEIANSRKWDCKGGCGLKPKCLSSCPDVTARVNAPGTLHSYDRYVHLVAKHLAKPISEITFLEICQAIGAVRKEQGYSASTAGNIASVLRRIFEYASEHGDADNITAYTQSHGPSELDILVLLGSDHPKDYIRVELRKERERLAKSTKSLAIQQLEKLTSLLWDRMEQDGRYCLVCLMLYAGVRPAEGRALRWKDITPFVDHPDRELINVFRIRDRRGQIQTRCKTDNAYRRIPVHFELAQFLQKRRDFVARHTEGSIDNLPICCYKNNFSRPCRDYEAATLAKELFSRLSMSSSNLYAYQIELLSEEMEGNQTADDKDQHITLYVLRKNFWTTLQSSTSLSDPEKRLIMGHELDEYHTRKDMNDENLLYDICLKMDHFVLSKELHEPRLFAPLYTQDTVSVHNQGLCCIHLTEDMLSTGVKLQISSIAEEPGEEIRLKSRSPLRSIGGITPQVQVVGLPPNSTKSSINCEYETWQAHCDAGYRRRKETD